MCVAHFGDDFVSIEDCIPELLEEAEVGISAEEAQDLLEYLGVQIFPHRWRTTPDGTYQFQRAGDYIVTVTLPNKDEVRIEDPQSWFDTASQDPDSYVDSSSFNEEFWEYPGVVYHATPSENVESILASGLSMASKTRGISNRWVSAAVYTTVDLEEAQLGSYGDAIFEIDCGAMKRDGYTPRVEQEPNIAEAAQLSSLAHLAEIEDYEPDIEGGMSPHTVVIHGAIPAEYLRLVEET